MPDLDDAAILQRVGRRDYDAFDVFVARYHARLVHYLGSFADDRHAIDDLAQDVFVKVFRAALKGQYDNGRPMMAAWVFRIARNCAIDHLRHRRVKPLELVGEMTDALTDESVARAQSKEPGNDPLAAAIDNEQTDSARLLMQQLPDPQREVVQLKIFGELTFAEIAEVLDCPLPTVKSRMRYALAALREKLTEGSP